MTRRIALALAALTIVMAAALVGTENHDGLLDLVSKRLSIHSAAAAPQAHPQEASHRSTEPEFDFATDEELIDDAAGLDPTPEEFENGRIEDDTQTSDDESESEDDFAEEDSEGGPTAGN